MNNRSRTTPKPKRNRGKAHRVPRDGTFAAFVFRQPVAMRPAAVAELARAAGFARASAQSVSSTRWYYGMTERPTLAEAAAGGASSTSVASHDVVPVDLLRMITRYGTDAVERALARSSARVAELTMKRES